MALLEHTTRRPPRVAAITAAAALAVGAVWLGLQFQFPGAVPEQTHLRAAHESCNAGQLVDSDRTLRLDIRRGAADPGPAVVGDLLCVLTYLDAPAYLMGRITAAGPDSGQLTDAWDTFDASWGYQPGHSLNVVIRES